MDIVQGKNNQILVKDIRHQRIVKPQSNLVPSIIQTSHEHRRHKIDMDLTSTMKSTQHMM